METKPVLVTITAPSAGGKSYLFNYIRDVAKMPCLISTTTRAPRVGEVEGVDYFFISSEQSHALESDEQFAELAIFNGNRYGVTKKEFHTKLQGGIAFLIVEPGGIDHYVAPALEVGALHYKTYIHVNPEVRMQRFRDRASRDIAAAMKCCGGSCDLTAPTANVSKVFNSYMDRLTLMLTIETKWFEMCQWDRVLFGDHTPEQNLNTILSDIAKLRAPKQ